MVLLTGTEETVMKTIRKHPIYEVSEEKNVKVSVSEEKNFKVSDGQEDTL